MTEQQTQTTLSRDRQLTGKYLSFSLAGQEYAVEALSVREIIGMQEITAVPRAPEYIKGVINLRGRVIPVLDLRLKLGLPEHEQTRSTAIIITQTRNAEFGIIVDQVQEVLDVAAADIEATPEFGTNVDIGFILGIGKIDDSVKILLDIEKVFGGDDYSSFTGVTNNLDSQD